MIVRTPDKKMMGPIQWKGEGKSGETSHFAVEMGWWCTPKNTSPDFFITNNEGFKYLFRRWVCTWYHAGGNTCVFLTIIVQLSRIFWWPMKVTLPR